MSGEAPEGQIPSATGNPTPAKKPYQKPAFRYERVFEMTALTCGKIQPVNQQCKFNRKTS